MIPAPPNVAPSDLADWVEVACLKGKRPRISQSDALGQLRRYEVPGAEDKCESVWIELARRSRAIGSAYPFDISTSSIERTSDWIEHVVYTMLVLLGTASHHAETTIKNYNKVALLFEDLARVAIERYVGGKAVRIGHPRKHPVPKRFSELLPFLSGQLGEEIRRTGALNKATKDCRADIIAWKPFADRRGGQLVVLAQCALGGNWKTKLTECDVKLWERYIGFVVSPIRAYAIPYVEEDDDLWIEYGTLGGIAFDRLRLVEQLAIDLPTTIAANARSWAGTQMAKVPWDD